MYYFQHVRCRDVQYGLKMLLMNVVLNDDDDDDETRSESCDSMHSNLNKTVSAGCDWEMNESHFVYLFVSRGKPISVGKRIHIDRESLHLQRSRHMWLRWLREGTCLVFVSTMIKIV